MVGSRRVKFGERVVVGRGFWSVCSDIETASGQSRSWVVIDVASHPERPEVLLQSFSADQGQHALVYNGEVLLWNLGSLGSIFRPPRGA